VLVPVAHDMKSDILAQVLANMNSESAKALTVKLADRLTLPDTTNAAPVAAASPAPSVPAQAAATPPGPQAAATPAAKAPTPVPAAPETKVAPKG
jgi:hypothetical protein